MINRRNFFKSSAALLALPPTIAALTTGCSTKSSLVAQTVSSDTTPALLRTQVTVTPTSGQGGTHGQPYSFPGLTESMVQSFSFTSIILCQGITVQLLYVSPGNGMLIYGWSSGGAPTISDGITPTATINIIAQ